MNQKAESKLKCPVGVGWKLLKDGDSIQPGDGFLSPEYPYWIAFECRPDLFRGDKEYVHSWPWRRRTPVAQEKEGRK